MFFSERKMHSNFSLMEIDVRKGIFGIHSRIEPKPQFSYHNFSLKLNYEVIESFKCGREIQRGEYTSFLDDKFKRFTNIDREILIRKCINEAFPLNIGKITSFSENFSNREGASHILNSSIVSCITANILKRSKCENTSITRYNSCV